MNQNTNIQLPGKPFDLQKAIAGEPLITRDGRKARYGTHSENCTDGERSLIMWVESEAIIGKEHMNAYRLDGKYFSGESCLDLFMAPKTVKKWVSIGINNKGIMQMDENLFDSEEEALGSYFFQGMNIESGWRIHSTHEIIIEL